MEFQELATKFTERLEQRRMSYKTLALYAWAAKKLTHHFFGYEVGAIGPEDIVYFKSTATDKAAASVNVMLTVLHAMLAYAAELGVIQQSAIPKMHFLKPNVKETAMTPEEQDRLLLYCRGPLKIMVYLALTLGLRRDSVFSLRWSEIQGGILKKKTKRGKTIELPIAPRVWLMLEHHRDRLKKKGRLGDFVFPSPLADKVRTRAADGGLNTAFKNAGLNYTGWHILRHTFATNFLRQTNNLVLLKEILGHANITQTSRYCHPDLETKKNALDAYSGQVVHELIPQQVLGRASGMCPATT